MIRRRSRHLYSKVIAFNLSCSVGLSGRLNLHSEGTRKIEEEKKTKTDNFKNKLVKFYFQLQVHAFNGRALLVYLEMVSKEAKRKQRKKNIIAFQTTCYRAYFNAKLYKFSQF